VLTPPSPAAHRPNVCRLLLPLPCTSTCPRYGLWHQLAPLARARTRVLYGCALCPREPARPCLPLPASASRSTARLNWSFWEGIFGGLGGLFHTLSPRHPVSPTKQTPKRKAAKRKSKTKAFSTSLRSHLTPSEHLPPSPPWSTQPAPPRAPYIHPPLLDAPEERLLAPPPRHPP
jgi:hypothetical protein